MSGYNLTFYVVFLYNLFVRIDKMEYLKVSDISEKWNIKERKITDLCREGRIAGAKKIGNVARDTFLPE